MNMARLRFLDKHTLYSRSKLKGKGNLFLPRKFSKRGLFLDIDGTLWPDSGPGSLVQGTRVDRKTEEAVKSLRVEFDHLILVTNQTYFARVGSPNTTDLKTYKKNARDLAEHLEVDMLLSCHHHPEAENLSLRRNCEYRKPNSGMLERAIQIFGLSPEKSVMVGDRITDIQAASRVNIENRFLIANPKAFEVNISPQTIIEPGLHFRAIKSLAELGSLLERGTDD